MNNQVYCGSCGFPHPFKPPYCPQCGGESYRAQPTTKVCSSCGGWDNCEYCDEAHQSDMRALRREQLRADISNEEALEELDLVKFEGGESAEEKEHWDRTGHELSVYDYDHEGDLRLPLGFCNLCDCGNGHALSCPTILGSNGQLPIQGN